ncbi:MAG: hypothetical protein M1830_005318, partial [Pleopsidium flavum]
HGARLDAADKQWHLTSPTPYDPPLTYGGWAQSRALGARIASILHARETSYHDRLSPNGNARNLDTLDSNEAQAAREEHPTHHKPARRERRKHRVIIHTSPFLRCVQTSIAISAGVAQYQGSLLNNTQISNSKPHQMHSGSPHLHPIESGNSPHLSAILEPEEHSRLRTSRRQQKVKMFTKPLLRLDAFLGEWLSPDYFDLITPPPNSLMMIASAKAELLRRGEYTQSFYESSSYRSGNFPGGWRGGWGDTTRTTDDDDGGPLTSLSTLGQTLPKHNRANSHSSAGSIGSTGSGKELSKLSTAVSTEHSGYTPPTPTYAISPSGPIPPGYVAHARDACVDVDYQWDSMREPQQWGNGGEYGEEWTAMHKRFRAGLQKMLSWYRSHEAHVRPGSASGSTSTAHHSAEDNDDDIDTVLVLVTHGAGCNALIGALTNQPVLLDVGMASLTMAIRKENIASESDSHADSEHPCQSTISHRRSSIDLGISDDYDVKVVASTEHLRAGSSTLSPSQAQSPRISSPQISTYRHRYGSHGSTSSPVDGGFSLGEPAATRAIMRNGIGGGPQRSSSVTSSPRSLTGLWSRPSLGLARQEDVPCDPLMSVAGDSVIDPPGPKRDKENVQTGTEEGETVAVSHEDSARTDSQHGLWGAPPPVVQNERDRGPKRRWTVNEHR